MHTLPLLLLAIAFVMFELVSASPLDISKRQAPLKAPGVTYSPYKGTPGKASCKTQQEIAADIKRLSPFGLIRLYGCDCNQVEHIMAATKTPLFVGIYNVDQLKSEVDRLCKAVNNNWSQIHTISVGNECVLTGKKTASQMVALANQARELLRARGYKGPVVTVEVFYKYLEDPTLCQGTDYIACNAHPYFDGKVEAKNAGSFLAEMVKQVSKKCGKKVLITETGWPTQGGANGVAVPSLENQKAALADIQKHLGNDYIGFSAFDETWKPNTAATNGVEQHWGIVH